MRSLFSRTGHQLTIQPRHCRHVPSDDDDNDGDDDDDGDDNNEGEISARQQISRKFQLPTNFGEVLTDGQTLYQLLTRPENITIRDDHGRRFQDHMT